MVLEAEDRGRERDGGKPRLEDIFAILYRDMDVSCMSDRLIQLSTVEGLTVMQRNDALYSFLTDFRSRIDNLFTS